MLQSEHMADLVYRYPVQLGLGQRLRRIEYNPALEIEPPGNWDLATIAAGWKSSRSPSTSCIEQLCVSSACQSRSRILAQESIARRNCWARSGFAVASRTPRSMCPCFSNSEWRLQGG